MTNTEEAVGRTLYDYLEILHRRRWLAAAVTAGVFAAFAGYAFLSKPVYRASTLVDVEKPEDVLAAGAYQAPDDEFLPTQAKLIDSDRALRDVYDRLDLAAVPEFSAGVRALRKAVTVMPVPRTRLCYVNVESRDASRAAQLANALARRFVDQNPGSQLFMLKKALADLDAKAGSPGARKFLDSLPAVQASASVQDIDTQLVKAQTDLAKLRASFTDQHPAVVAAKSELALLQAARAAEVDRVVRGLRTRLSGQFHPNNVRVVDAALPPDRPVRPRKALALALGLAAGLALGGLTALGAETLDETVRTHQDLERGLGLPLLGHIPLSPLKRGERVYSPLVSADVSSVSEAFRNLRTMVAFAKAADPEPFLLVTSSVQEEGKSFVATNLAVASSQLGRKVLLIDGDLRRPSQHVLLSVGAKKGLSDFLSGRVQNPAELLQKTDVPNLDVLAGGSRPPNPSELLNAEQLAALILWARERYDRVIVDCPPVFPVSDILLWGRHVRSSILVSRAGRTPMPLARTACARLRAGGIDVLGGVINGARRGALGREDGHDFDKYCRRA